jgi:hypothetical protein
MQEKLTERVCVRERERERERRESFKEHWKKRDRPSSEGNNKHDRNKGCNSSMQIQERDEA